MSSTADQLRIAELEKDLANERKWKNAAYSDRSRLTQVLAFVLRGHGHEAGFRLHAPDHDPEWPVLAIRLTKDNDRRVRDSDTAPATDEIAFHIKRSDLMLTDAQLQKNVYVRDWEFASLVETIGDDEKDELYARDAINRASRMQEAVDSNIVHD